MAAAEKKKKPDLALVIGMGGKPKGEPDGDEPMDAEEGGDEQAHEDAMSELSGAITANDMPRAVEAFKVLYDLCAADHEGGEEEAEEA